MEIEDASKETVETLKFILYKDFMVSLDDINSKLLLFADKYKIKPLYDVCAWKLGIYLNKENILDIASAAAFLDDEHLLNKIAEYFNVQCLKSWPTILDYPSPLIFLDF